MAISPSRCVGHCRLNAGPLDLLSPFLAVDDRAVLSRAPTSAAMMMALAHILGDERLADTRALLLLDASKLSMPLMVNI